MSLTGCDLDSCIVNRKLLSCVKRIFGIHTPVGNLNVGGLMIRKCGLLAAVAVLCCLDLGDAYVRRLAGARHFSAPLSGERKITRKLYAREKFKQKSTYFVVSLTIIYNRCLPRTVCDSTICNNAFMCFDSNS